ncbi:XRE family transcriptional regulator [Planococcus rifietoensis]|uniref:XRE family transcriptional regulator n=1 Tax=Planococcus rifietoensis TaxID=200991 RepID=UPI00384DD6E8
MSTILEGVQVNAYQRPKYNRYELARLVSNKRVKSDLSIHEIASQFNVEPALWESIENGSRTYDQEIYRIVAQFLNTSVASLLEKEQDDISSLSYRTIDEDSTEVANVVELANKIFQELVMQEKISV